MRLNPKRCFYATGADFETAGEIQSALQREYNLPIIQCSGQLHFTGYFFTLPFLYIQYW